MRDTWEATSRVSCRRSRRHLQPLREFEERTPDGHASRVSRGPAHGRGELRVAEAQLDASDDGFPFLRLERGHGLVVYSNTSICFNVLTTVS
jgi:hypothetical protein